MNKRKCIIIVLLVCSLLPIVAQTNVIAHRGYWKTDGSAQNSIAALLKADSINVYGSEVDFWLSADGVPVANHDAKIVDMGDTLVVENTDAARLRSVILSNGEPMPTAEEYLDSFMSCNNTKLIIEFKSHSTPEQEQELARKVIDMVNERGLQDKVEYIAFGINFINLVSDYAPDAPSYYLNGDLSPDEIKELGISGIDYNYNVICKNPHWVSECHNIGLKVNVWTVNNVEQLNNMLDLNVDFITTDDPILTKQLIEDMQ